MILTALIAALAQSPWEQPVTIDAKFIKTEAVLAQISQKSGLELAAAGDLRKYPLYLRTRNTPLKELLPKIALVTGGEWQKRGSTWILSADASLKAQQDKQPDPQRESRISQAINAHLRATKDQPELTERTLQITRANPETDQNTPDPDTRAIAELIQKIGPATLAQIQPESRVVFSTQPNPMQLSLPGDNSKILARFLREKQLIANNPLPQPEGSNEVFITRTLTFSKSNRFRVAPQPQPLSGDPNSPGPTLLVARRDGVSDALTFPLTRYDTSNRPIATGSFELSPAELEPTLALNSKTPLSLSPLAREYAHGFNQDQQLSFRQAAFDLVINQSSGPDRLNAESLRLVLNSFPKEFRPLSKSLTEFLKTVNRTDPWSVLGTPILDAVKTDQNIIALLPDQNFEDVAALLCEPQITAEKALIQLSQTENIVATSDQNWLTLRPSAPQTYRRSYVNRTALATLLRTTLTDGYADLTTVAKFVAQQDELVGGATFGYQHLCIAQRLATSGAEDNLVPSSYDLTRFIASLTPGQQRLALQGGSLPVSILQPGQLQLLSKIVFNAEDGPNYFDPNKDKSPRRPLNPVWHPERTLLLPNGISPTARFTFDPAEMKAEWLGQNSTTGQIEFGGPNLASDYFQPPETPKAKSLKTPPAKPKYDRFSPAQSFSYSFQLLLTPNAILRREFEDHQADTNRKLPFSQMPEDFKKEASNQAIGPN